MTSLDIPYKPYLISTKLMIRRAMQSRYRTLYVTESKFGFNYSQAMMKKIDSPEGHNIYSKRMGIIEPVFGNITACKKMNRFNYRTKRKVNSQWLLYCLVHNIGKIYRVKTTL